ncbi:DNA recombination protein RmuC [Acidovorax sp. 1608163]|uniref:DNA recombination protein RmuC n=1 Tax=Acidovorax sp. 1608163 TaxID=2478662 RepID=UPI000EF6AF97|nr:DNA recombination protein RmuC [Acidovorax sp. 1608163]AYM96086.1 DNA recombination protein RmuC [Acidovorax sp. 1608163]
MTTDTLVLLAALALVFIALALLALRRPRVDLPPEWLARLQTLERTTQATQLAVAKNDGALDGMGQQLRGFTQTTQTTLEGLRHAVDERLTQAVAESRNGRAELLAAFGVFEARLEQRLMALDAATRLTLDALKSDTQSQLGVMSQALKDQLEANSFQIKNQFAVLQDAVSQQLTGLVQGSQHNAEQLRTALNERLAAIQADNATKLEEMRRTVDEKLHATLEQRLGESFKLVSDRLEQVHKGLGEMQTLAGSVGDLKRVMTNVKSRGTWGEMQLGAIIDNVLTPEQFARNVKTVPGSDELVEFAIRLPGKSDEHPVWLPIDSKYPVEQYQRLMDAQDAADKAAILSAGNAFETSIKLEAKKIFTKYVSPPHTTDFAVLYLPTEGLFAEVMRRPGLVEAVQNECRVMITGPANLAAMLNSLQMGFKTLAIEKRSSEVWSLLGMVKTEFAKFGDVVEATKKSIDAAAKKFDEVGVRTRAIQRKLRDVQDLPAPEDDAAAPGGGNGALPGANASLLGLEDDTP